MVAIERRNYAPSSPSPGGYTLNWGAFLGIVLCIGTWGGLGLFISNL